MHTDEYQLTLMLQGRTATNSSSMYSSAISRQEGKYYRYQIMVDSVRYLTVPDKGAKIPINNPDI